MSRTPKVAIVGAGTVGRAFAAAARSINWPIAAIVSPVEHAAVDVATELDVRHAPIDQLPRVGAQLAVVTTPVGDHAGELAALLPRGVPTLVGAPLAPTLAECRAIVGMAERSRTALGLADPLIGSPAVQHLLAGIARMTAPLGHLSAGARHPHPNRATPDDRCDGSLGGVLFHRGASSLSALVLAARIGGWGRPTQVAAPVAAMDGPSRVELVFADDHRATLDIAWSLDGSPTWSLQAAGASDVYRAEFHPSPVLEFNGTEVHLPGRRLGDRMHPADSLGFAPTLRLFWDDVEAGRAPLLDATFGEDLWQIVAAAYRAVRSAEPVPLPLVVDEHVAPARIGSG